jgi:dCMP deaminase
MSVYEGIATKWNAFFFDIAERVSLLSKDRSTQVGCVLVKDGRIISTGYNGMPRRINDDVDSRHERPIKYSYMEHGERNAFFNCASEGISTKGSSLYVIPFAPCADCARAIIQCGVKEVHVQHDSTPELVKRWEESNQIALELLDEAGVPVYTYKKYAAVAQLDSAQPCEG